MAYDYVAINFESSSMSKKTHAGTRLVIHFDLNGLAALMKAVEAAMATGLGRVEPGSGVSVSSGAASHSGMTLTFSDRGGGLALAA